MAKIPVRPPNTPRELKAAKSAIHQLEKRSAKIRRDIMNRRVDNLSEARRIAASQSAKATELRIDLQNSPAVKYSKRNKYMRYRMPSKVRPIRRQRRRRVPLRRSIQASIATKNNRLQQSKAAKPFNVAKPSPKPPQIKRVVRRSPRRGYVRRMPQSPVRKARSIIKRPSRMSRMLKRMSRRTRSRSKRKALSQEASVQARNAKVAQSQLNKNRLQQQNARIAMMRRRYLQQQKQRARRSRVGPTPKDARRIISRSSRRQTYVIPSKSGKPVRVSKPVYDRYMAARKASMDRMRARRGTVRRPIVRRTPTRINRPRPKAVAIQNQQKVQQEIERRKSFAAQQARLRSIAARRAAAKMKSDSISQQRLRMLKSNISKSRSAAVVQAKQLEEHLAKVRAKQQSVANRLSPIKTRISTFRRSFKLGEANLGAIRRDDTLADNHRDNIQELSKLENEANALGAIARKLKQQEMNLQGELQTVSDQIGNLNPSRLFQENKENLSETKSLEKCLSNKLMQLNQEGHVSGEGINKAKAIIRQFDKRQIPFDEAKTRIYRTLKQAHTPRGGDMLKPDMSMFKGMLSEMSQGLAQGGNEFNDEGLKAIKALQNKYTSGQIKTIQEVGRLAQSIMLDPRYVQPKVKIAELGRARALGIAANIRNRKSRQLPAVRQLTAQRRAFYDKQRIAEEERLKKSQERVENRQSLAGIFPRTRSAMERMTR